MSAAPPPAGDELAHIVRLLRRAPARLVVLWAGCVLVAALALFPAWSGYNGIPKGYGPIFLPPKDARHIDLVRTGIPIALVAGLTAVIHHRYRRPD